MHRLTAAFLVVIGVLLISVLAVEAEKIAKSPRVLNSLSHASNRDFTTRETSETAFTLGSRLSKSSTAAQASSEGVVGDFKRLESGNVRNDMYVLRAQF